MKEDNIHHFKVLLNGDVVKQKSIEGTLKFAINYMTGYVQGFKEVRTKQGHTDDDIETLYVPEHYLAHGAN